MSDNHSNSNIRKIVKSFKKKLNIKFNRNKKNLGFGLNLLKVSQMAKGDFIWFLGDDDLLLPSAIFNLSKIITSNKKVDFRLFEIGPEDKSPGWFYPGKSKFNDITVIAQI